MSILKFSARLRELSDDYANQRVMPEVYRAERKIILDEIDNVLNGVESSHYAEESMSAEDDVSINEDLHDEDDLNIIDAINIEDSISAGEGNTSNNFTHMDEASHRHDSSNIEGISKKLNSVLGRLDEPDKDENV